MKKILFLSSFLVLAASGLFSLEQEEEIEWCENEEVCEKEDCKHKPRCYRKRRNFYSYPNRSEEATWPGKMEDSFMEQMMH